MAYQPTTNFGWAMPRGGDQAQISVINKQFTAKADEIVYQTRRMIAPGYIDDGTKTYQPGEIVEYENVDYVCTGTTSGAWDSSKWDATDMATQIQEAKESGGTTVVANPTGTASGTLESVGIGDTKYIVTPADMTGATSGAAGTHGLVPAPAAGSQGKYLKADGTWGEPDKAATWGQINGTLSNQSDLNARLTGIDTRVDNLLNIPQGSTTADAALYDIKTGFDGVVYPTPGDAVRGSDQKLQREIDDYDYLLNAKMDRIISAAFKPNDTSVTVSESNKTGMYLGPTTIASGGSGLVIYYIQVEKGYKYNLNYTKHTGSSATYTAVAFSTVEPAVGVVFESLQMASTTEVNIDYTYEPTENGYLMVQKSTTSGGTRSWKKITPAYALNDTISNELDEAVEAKIVADSISTTILGDSIEYSTISSLYMNTDGVFSSAGSGLKIYYIPVESRKRYNLKYSGHKMLGAYGAVGFSQAVPAASGAVTILQIATVETATDIDYTLTAPSNGYFCVSKSSEGTATPVFCPSYYAVNKNPKVQTLKIQLFGDSITDNTWGDNTTWANHIANMIPERNVTIINSAVGGTFLRKQSTGDGTITDLVTNGTTLDTSVDVVVVIGGTNDWASGGPVLGTFLDGTYSTIYGAVETICKYVTTNTNALLIFGTPPQRYNATDQERETDSHGTPINSRDYTLRQFCDAIIETCKYYGIPVVDLNAILGWNRNNVGRFTSDGLHPNNVGDYWIGRLMCNAIKEHEIAE